MKRIGTTEDGRLLVTMMPQEAMDLEECARTLLLTIGTLRLSLNPDSTPAGSSDTAGDVCNTRNLPSGKLAGCKDKYNHGRQKPRRASKLTAPAPAPSGKGLGLLKCGICGRDFVKVRKDQKANGKSCPGKPCPVKPPAKTAPAPRPAAVEPPAGAPCKACQGPIDRSGPGGYKRTICAACRDRGVSARSSVAHAAQPHGADRIRAALERVDKMSPDERNARTAAAAALVE
ncbi:MAG: hypothetical protein WCL44_08990 [bacterium]